VITHHLYFLLIFYPFYDVTSKGIKIKVITGSKIFRSEFPWSDFSFLFCTAPEREKKIENDDD